MAGGEGTRMRPITCDCPKPMVLLMDRPVLSYAFSLLRRHGVTDACVTLGYLPDQVRDYFSRYDPGLNVRYFTETKPMGTAGGVGQARKELTETFCVLSGDGVTDCDLTKALETHKRSGAIATMVLKRVNNPLEYGLVVTDTDGHVKAFVEKPGWGEVVTDTVNTGIYLFEPEIFSRIPIDRPYDFGRELFPALVKDGLPVYGYVMNDYWCDIGDTAAYLKAHYDALDGRIKLLGVGKPGMIFKHPDALIDRGCILEAPCWIGEGAHIYDGAHVGAYSVIGAGARVCARATVKRSILYPGACADEGTQLRGCVVMSGARVGECASAFEESILAQGAQLGARATLMPGVKLWPGKRVGAGVRVDSNVIWGARDENAFDGEDVLVKSPEEAARAAQIIADFLKPRELLLARSVSSVSIAYQKAVCAGLMAQRAQVIDMGAATLGQTRYTLSCVKADAALYIADGRISILKGDLCCPSLSERRALSARIVRQDAPAPFTGITRPPIYLGRCDYAYAGWLASAGALGDGETRVAVFAQAEPLLFLAERAFMEAGFVVRVEWEEELMTPQPDEICVWLSADGAEARFSDENGMLTDREQDLLIAWCALESGEKLIVAPAEASRQMIALAGSYGARVSFSPPGKAALMKCAKDASINQLYLRFDGLYLAVCALSRLRKLSLSLADWKARMPDLYERTRAFSVPHEKRGEVLRRFAQAVPAGCGRDGLCFTQGNACAWVVPDEEKPVMRVKSEARDAETAREFCDFLYSLLENAAAPTEE